MENTLLSELTSEIPILMDAYDIPGLSIAVTHDTKSILLDGFGFTDMTRVMSTTENTNFSCQSISKMFTAIGFMHLSEKYKIEIDQKVVEFLPTFKPKSRISKDEANQISFRHLLTHTSGLPHEAPVGNNLDWNCEFKEHIRSINDVWLKFAVGERYSYSNLGYDILSCVVENVSEISFADYMEQNIFPELGMHHSTYNQQRALSDLCGASGHYNKSVLPRTQIPMIGAGGMYSCASDMSNFIRYVLSPGDMISRQSLESMYDPRNGVPMNGTGDTTWKYCFGFVVGEIDGVTLLNHNGGGYGYYASLYIAPKERIGVAAFTNSVDHPQVQSSLALRIVKRLKRIDEIKTPRKITPGFDYFAGVYRTPGAPEYGITRRLSIREGSMFLDEEELQYHSDKLFFTASGDTVEFLENGARIENMFYEKRR